MDKQGSSPPLRPLGQAISTLGLTVMLLGGCALNPNIDREDAAELIDPGGLNEVWDLLESSHSTLLPDCDGNGIGDLQETGPTRFGFAREVGPFPVDVRARHALSADLDGDGWAELMSLNHPGSDIEDGSLSVVWDDWIAADDRRSDSVALRESALVRHAIADDFTENGSRDIAILYEQLEIRGVSHYQVPKLVLLRNAGDGVLVHRRFVDEYTLGDYRDTTYRMVAADYDGDRDVDLFVTWKDGSESAYGRDYKVALLTNRSDLADDGALFDVRSSISSIDAESTGAIVAAHLDGDRDLELITPYDSQCAAPSC